MNDHRDDLTGISAKIEALATTGPSLITERLLKFHVRFRVNNPCLTDRMAGKYSNESVFQH